MALSKTAATIEFNRVVSLGWLAHFEEAVQVHTRGHFDAADLMGIASRESNFNPNLLIEAGDHGHGYGLMQVDNRSFPEWVNSGRWTNAREGILKGAEVLMQKWRDVQSCIGKECKVRDSKTKIVYDFVGKDVGQGEEARQVTIASYNNGRWPHYNVSKNLDPDRFTTGHDYSHDVASRAAFFRALIQSHYEDSYEPEAPADAGTPVTLPVNPIDTEEYKDE